ncbi:type VI secretion protein [Chromatium weissei]|nr:type VI secretion protein [Chromatium weissei]
MIDIDVLLKEISPAQPCGEDLEYDAAYGALERATRGKPEQQFGNTIVPAEPPDWAQVQREAIELFKRTKDLRIAAYLTQALIRTQGWTGFRDGLNLIQQLLMQYWEDVHPLLDPDDDHDPTLRINTIVTLCDPEMTLDGLRFTPLVSARGIGNFSLRDWQIANKEIAPPKNDTAPPAELNVIEAAFQQVEFAVLQETANAIRQSRQLLATIEALLLERVGAGTAPDMTALSELIREAEKTIASPLALRIEQSPELVNAAIEECPTDEEQIVATSSASPVASSALNTIHNRDDVIRVIDLLCDYYQRQEPSSPIPLLLRRAKLLVKKDFLEILEELAPDGLAQAQALRGSESNT